MTVDSRYIPESYENDGEVYYPFQLESVGETAFEVYKVTDLARTLLTLDYHYTIDFEEHLDPIKKRGRIKLAAPLSADGHLEVLRKTPIVNPFEDEPMQALKPFPTEAFENALDRICFIQQEIEGHLCDCRGPVWPPPPSVPDPDRPECNGYSCEAFVAYAAAEGYNAVPFSELQGDSPTLPLYFDLYDGGTSTIKLGDGYEHLAGLPFPTSVYQDWDLNNSGLTIGVCENNTRGLKLNAISFSPGQQDVKKFLFPGNSLSLVHQGFASGWSSISTLMGYGLVFRNTHLLNGFVQEVNITPAISWSPPSAAPVEGFCYPVQGGYASMGNPTFDTGQNHTTLIAEYLGLRIERPYGNPDLIDAYAQVRYTATHNETIYTADAEYLMAYSPSSGNGGVVSCELISTGDAFGFAGAGGNIYSLVYGTGLDADKLYQFYLQNFEDWEMPADCVLEYTEYPDTPDVPNIFGE